MTRKHELIEIGKMLASVCFNRAFLLATVATAIDSAYRMHGACMPYVLSACVHRALWDQIRRERGGGRGREGGKAGDGRGQRDSSSIS